MTLTQHYMRFVDGFWRIIAAWLRIVGCKRLAARLSAWNNWHFLDGVVRNVLKR